jgi:hypothetical protein
MIAGEQPCECVGEKAFQVHRICSGPPMYTSGFPLPTFVRMSRAHSSAEIPRNTSGSIFG